MAALTRGHRSLFGPEVVVSAEGNSERRRRDLVYEWSHSLVEVGAASVSDIGGEAFGRHVLRSAPTLWSPARWTCCLVLSRAYLRTPRSGASPMDGTSLASWFRTVSEIVSARWRCRGSVGCACLSGWLASCAPALCPTLRSLLCQRQCPQPLRLLPGLGGRATFSLLGD